MPGITCIVPGCRRIGYRDQRGRKISYHSVPAKESLRKLWLEFINKKKPFKVRQAKVCSLHFRDEDFLKNIKSGLRLLTAGAVPSLLPPPREYVELGDYEDSQTKAYGDGPNGGVTLSKGVASSDAGTANALESNSAGPVIRSNGNTQETHLEYTVEENDSEGIHNSMKPTSLALKYQVVCQSEGPAAAKQRCTSWPKVHFRVVPAVEEAPRQSSEVEPLQVGLGYSEPPLQMDPGYGEVPLQMEQSYSEGPLQMDPGYSEVPLQIEQSYSEAPLQIEQSCTNSSGSCETLPTDMILGRADGDEHSGRVEELERKLCEEREKVAILERQLGLLQTRCRMLEAQKSTFSADYFKNSRADFQFYTGLPSYEVFKAILKYLNPGEGGSNIDFGTNTAADKNIQLSLDIENQCFLVLTKLKLGMFTKDLAHRLALEESTVDKIFCSWIHFMCQRLGALPLWGSRQAVDRRMPADFAEKFPKARVTLAATEIGCRSAFQKEAFTMKGMIGMSPDGLVSFVSPLFPGITSNRDMVRESGFLKLQFDAGDCVIANRDFCIADLLEPLKVKLSIWPQEKRNVIDQDVQDVRSVALEMIQKRVEAIMSFHILDTQVATDGSLLADKIWMVCCVLTNFQGRRL